MEGGTFKAIPVLTPARTGAHAWERARLASVPTLLLITLAENGLVLTEEKFLSLSLERLWIKASSDCLNRLPISLTVPSLTKNGTVQIANNEFSAFQAFRLRATEHRKWDSSFQVLTNDQNFSIAKTKPKLATNWS